MTVTVTPFFKVEFTLNIMNGDMASESLLLVGARRLSGVTVQWPGY